MSDSLDGKVDYKESYFKALEENEVLADKVLEIAAINKRLEARIKYIEPVYYLALEVASWDWRGILKERETDDGAADLFALCESTRGHP